MKLETKQLETDVLIIGGGTAGCFCAITLGERSNLKILIAEKANIKRSGCLAAGVNALNAYIGIGETPDSFVDYVKQDSDGLIREDLVYTIAQKLNGVTSKLESLGLPILKDENGDYVGRGKRSIKINGENIKPLIAKAVAEQKNVDVLNGLNIIDYLQDGEKIIGAYGLSILDNKVYFIYSKVVVCATGGAAGIYKPNNPGFSGHKMWYSPFNTGAGYAMGIRAGAEMTTFEMRFIALRCKDTIAPTGTIAQGIRAEQINVEGEHYVKKYGKPTTPIRLYSTVLENQSGKGPCYLKTKEISQEVENDLFKAYLNMAPAQTLKWVEENTGPSKENVEIEGTEPYIVGGHTASGYWVDEFRRTTLKGLYAIGDVAGGSPKKYVTGCFAEGEITAEHILKTISNIATKPLKTLNTEEKVKEFERYLTRSENLSELEEREALTSLSKGLGIFEREHQKKNVRDGSSEIIKELSITDIETSMQEVMDEYAGGISQGYIYCKDKLTIALSKIEELQHVIKSLKATNVQELIFIYELIDRLFISKVLIHHLLARKETRWRCYQENKDYPNKDDENFLHYINSIYKEGKVHMINRDLIGREAHYEHSDQ